MPRLRPTASTSGRSHVMGVLIIPRPPATFLPMWWARKTSTSTVPGAMFLNTETFGSQAVWTRAGRPIAMAIGSGLRPGDGPGLKTSPGDTLPSTTAAGCITTIFGDGRLDRSMPAPTTLPHWSHGLVVRAGARTSDSVSAEVLVGARWD